jgi:hypothetical protein
MRKSIRKRLKSLLKVRFFWIITLFGNACLIGGALLFHWLESGANPNVGHFVDSLAWAVGLVTTVGGGNVAPVTLGGKILGIVMMMGGALFLWSYMALFIGILVEPELSHIQREVDEIQHDVRDLTSAKGS